jgi:hypothetical protein
MRCKLFLFLCNFGRHMGLTGNIHRYWLVGRCNGYALHNPARNFLVEHKGGIALRRCFSGFTTHHAAFRVLRFVE